MDDLSLYGKPILASLIYSVLGSLVLMASIWCVGKVVPFSMRKEIEEDHNTAFGIILGAIILGLSLIISAAIQG